MFTIEWATVAVAGFCIGMLVSLPIGAVSMQAAYRWADRNYRDALAMAVGVLVGDLFVAISVMRLLQAGVVSVSWQYMLGGALMMFVMSGVIKRHLHYIETVKSIPQCLILGFVVTVIQPGNYGTYLLSYGGQWMSVQYLFGVPNVIEMPDWEVVLLIGMNCTGLVFGWFLYFGAIGLWGMRFKEQFSWWTPLLVALAGVITLVELGYEHSVWRLI